jgi:hypothetical protein
VLRALPTFQVNTWAVAVHGVQFDIVEEVAVPRQSVVGAIDVTVGGLLLVQYGSGMYGQSGCHTVEESHVEVDAATDGETQVLPSFFRQPGGANTDVPPVAENKPDGRLSPAAVYQPPSHAT